MHDLFRQVLRKGPKLKASDVVCTTEIKAEMEISCISITRLFVFCMDSYLTKF